MGDFMTTIERDTYTHRMNLDDTQAVDDSAQPMIELWSREGFTGEIAVVKRLAHVSDFTHVEGPHAPRRLVVGDIDVADRDDPWALPTQMAVARSGVGLRVSKRSTDMPFVMRNVEVDELHFVQEGIVHYVTDYGELTAEPGDFVHLPKSVGYRTAIRSESSLVVILDSPQPLRLAPPAPFGMINFSLHVKQPTLVPATGPGGETLEYLLSFDGPTVFTRPTDPLAAAAIIGGAVPVWKLNLRHISPLTYGDGGGPPAPFLRSDGGELMLYTLSTRPTARPPMHHNVDYEELIFWHDGEVPWGAVDAPGTLTHVPRGVNHHGPREDTPGQYWSWLLEVGSTVRFNPGSLEVAEIMETDNYGRHPQNDQ